MNLYELLRQDHRKVKEIFDQLEHAGADGMEQLLSSLRREILLHSEVEEKFFYGPLKLEEDTREIILESLDDHRDFRKLLDRIDALDRAGGDCSAALADLRDNLERHIEEEEAELFPRARKVLGEEEAAGIAEDIEAYKEEHSELEAH